MAMCECEAAATAIRTAAAANAHVATTAATAVRIPLLQHLERVQVRVRLLCFGIKIFCGLACYDASCMRRGSCTTKRASMRVQHDAACAKTASDGHERGACQQQRFVLQYRRVRANIRRVGCKAELMVAGKASTSVKHIVSGRPRRE